MDKRGRGRPRVGNKREFKVLALLNESEGAEFRALCVKEGLTASSMMRKLVNMATMATKPAFPEEK